MGDIPEVSGSECGLRHLSFNPNNLLDRKVVLEENQRACIADLEGLCLNCCTVTFRGHAICLNNRPDLESNSVSVNLLNSTS